MTPEQVSARLAVEALRAGVPSRAVVSRLGTTQDRIRERFETAVDQVRGGLATSPLVVAANFGEGKSHLLQYLRAAAARLGFVTASLVVSPETPLGRPNVVLRALAEAAEAPDRTGAALHALATDIPSNSDLWVGLRQWLDDQQLNERFAALLHIYQQCLGDEELRRRVLEDIEGKPLQVSEIRRGLREVGQAGVYQVGAVRNTLLAPERLRLYAALCRAVTGAGLVVFFDELERLRRFTRRQRFAAYEQIGWWLRLAEQPGCGVLPVFATTSGFVQETITDGLFDQQYYRVAVEEVPAEQHALGLAGLELLTAKPLPLRPPTPEQLTDICYRVRELYATAYGQQPVELTPRRRSAGSLRQTIRTWITTWDLQRYDPSAEVQIEEQEVQFDQDEIPDDVVASDDAEPAEQ